MKNEISYAFARNVSFLIYFIGMINAKINYVLMNERPKTNGKELKAFTVDKLYKCVRLCDKEKFCHGVWVDLVAKEQLSCLLHDLCITEMVPKKIGSIGYPRFFKSIYFDGECFKEIALRNKPCRQITTNFGLGCSYSIDGNFGGRCFVEKCSSTAFTANPWWYVDTVGCYSITKVILFNRTDMDMHYFDYITVQVQDQPMPNQSNARICVTGQRYSTTRARVFYCNEKAFGRYLVVRLSIPGRNTPLVMTEVRAFGYSA